MIRLMGAGRGHLQGAHPPDPHPYWPSELTGRSLFAHMCHTARPMPMPTAALRSDGLQRRAFSIR
eukprot:2727045-Pyramimonas_sp.AAC.1